MIVCFLYIGIRHQPDGHKYLERQKMGCIGAIFRGLYVENNEVLNDRYHE